MTSPPSAPDLVARLRAACFCKEISRSATCKLCESAAAIERLRAALEKIAQAGEIHDPIWAGSIAREALRGAGEREKGHGNP